MKKTLFMTTAAIAMLAGVHFVNAQGAGGGAGGGGAGTPSGSSQMEQRGGSGSMGGSGQMGTQRGAGSEMQRGGSSDHQTSGQRPGATASEKQAPDSSRSAQQPSKSQNGQRTGQSSQSKETTGSAPSSTQVTAEQKTKIKSHMGELRAGRVDNVNFSIHVGTVVPRTVELHTLPAAIIEIVPAYRGYKYILVKDEIVIIDPNTLRIVAVIEA